MSISLTCGLVALVPVILSVFAICYYCVKAHKKSFCGHTAEFCVNLVGGSICSLVFITPLFLTVSFLSYGFEDGEISSESYTELQELCKEDGPVKDLSIKCMSDGKITRSEYWKISDLNVSTTSDNSRLDFIKSLANKKEEK